MDGYADFSSPHPGPLLEGEGTPNLLSSQERIEVR
jgi:hypothetical protein